MPEEEEEDEKEEEEETAKERAFSTLNPSSLPLDGFFDWAHISLLWTAHYAF